MTSNRNDRIVTVDRNEPPAASADGATAHAVSRWGSGLLFATSWISGVVFAAYIAVFFGGTLLAGAGERWNESLPGLHDPATPMAIVAIGVHFLTGAVLLLLGPIQFIGHLRRRVPALHRWLGRLYVASAALAGIGGLFFIVARGTVGGAVMDIGFGLYGILMVVCAALAFVHARAGRFGQHRAWAIRLFALTIGSWLYRMEYGAWFLVAGGVGTGRGFTGWFDAVMAFFFYLPNLVVAEWVIRSTRSRPTPLASIGSGALMLFASSFVALVTWLFIQGAWGRRIASGLLTMSS